MIKDWAFFSKFNEVSDSLITVSLSFTWSGCIIYHSITNLMLYSGKTKKYNFEILIYKTGFRRASHIYSVLAYVGNQ